MPWCPKCKNEYRAGIAICPDCNEDLLEELTESIALDFVPLFQTADEELKNKLVKYLIHCGRKIQEESGIVETEEGKQNVYAIFVPKADYQEAMKEIRTVIAYDAKLETGEEDLKPRHRAPEPSTLYVDAKSRYQEYKSSGIMFLVFGVLFLGFIVLNYTGVISVMNSAPSLIVLGMFCISFFTAGINSLRKISSLKEEASAEESTTEDIMAYLKDVFPKEELEKITKSNFNTGEELSGEELYFERIAQMKNYVMSEYPDKDENYVDALLEEYYDSLNL